MSEKDYKALIDLAERKLAEPTTKEQALASLVNAGILDQSGKYTEPYSNLAAVTTVKEN